MFTCELDEFRMKTNWRFACPRCSFSLYR